MYSKPLSFQDNGIDRHTLDTSATKLNKSKILYLKAVANVVELSDSSRNHFQHDQSRNSIFFYLPANTLKVKNRYCATDIIDYLGDTGTDPEDGIEGEKYKRGRPGGGGGR
ncbi:hypothetical protein BgiMline_035017 [Biomphalaria glabrata]